MASCWVSVDAALDDAAGPEVRHHGADEADRIDAEMPVEPAVLDGDHRLRQVGRHLVEGQRLADRVGAVGDQRSVRRDDADIDRPVRQLPFRGRRQLGPGIADQRDDADRQHDPGDRRPVDDAAHRVTDRGKEPAAGPRAARRRAPGTPPLWRRRLRCGFDLDPEGRLGRGRLRPTRLFRRGFGLGRRPRLGGGGLDASLRRRGGWFLGSSKKAGALGAAAEFRFDTTILPAFARHALSLLHTPATDPAGRRWRLETAI